MRGIQEEVIKYAICHTVVTSATNYYYFLSLSLNIEPSHLFCQMSYHLLPLFLKKSVLWKGGHSSSVAGPSRLPAKGSFRQSWSCSREHLSASSFCLLPGSFPFRAHLGLSLKGTLKIQDSVFITRTHLLNMRLHLEPYTNKLTLVFWEWSLFFFLSQDSSFPGH